MLIRRDLHLRVESGLLSGIDLASDKPDTKMMASVLAAVLEFQRDMISENTHEGIAAAAASGKTLGRPAGPPARRVLDAGGARDLPEHLDVLPAGADEQHQQGCVETEFTIGLPGRLADHLRTAGDETIRRPAPPGAPAVRRYADTSKTVLLCP
ncbi:recombinase family protein [Streptomyces sp. NPDC056544]|uniref:recombinase family protein n=1 Tax=unclassified Streptomyces TaxID=2593676 RepID=UPI0036C193D1